MGAKDSHFLTVGESTWVRNKKVMVEHHKEPGYISHWDLLLMDVAKDDGGVYECQITDKEKYVRHVTLEVSDAESVSTSKSGTAAFTRQHTTYTHTNKHTKTAPMLLFYQNNFLVNS